MPEITAMHIALSAATTVVGAVAGWIVRGRRCAEERTAVGEGWQQRLDGQRAELDRLVEQNKNLMQQVSQLQASGKDGTNRARELSAALKEAFARRDELQRELKEIRGHLESAVAERDRLQSDIAETESVGLSVEDAMKDKDEKIFRLSRELENWHNRLPPLIERYRQRDEEARALELKLADAEQRIYELETADLAGQTRVEPVDSESLADGLDASNDQYGMTQTGITNVFADDEEETDSAIAGSADDARNAEGAAPAADHVIGNAEAQDDELDDDTSGAAVELPVPDTAAGDGCDASERFSGDVEDDEVASEETDETSTSSPRSTTCRRPRQSTASRSTSAIAACVTT